MKKLVCTLMLLPISISAQSIYGMKRNFVNSSNNSTTVYRMDFDCDTVELHSGGYYEIIDYHLINDNELLFINGNGVDNGLYHKNLSTGEITFKHGVFQLPGSSGIETDYIQRKIFRLKSGEYLLEVVAPCGSGYVCPRLLLFSSDLSTYNDLGNLGLYDDIIEPIPNRIFMKNSVYIVEVNLFSNASYTRSVDGNGINQGYNYIATDFTYTSDNKIVYYMKLNGGSSAPNSIPRGYVYSYDLTTSVNTKIDSIFVGTTKETQFGYAPSLNFVGNNEIIVASNSGGANGIGQVSKYNVLTKSMTTIYSYASGGEIFKNPINHGMKFMDFQRKGDLSVPSISQCIPNVSSNEYENLKCPNCTFNGVAPLSIDELEVFFFSIFPNPTNTAFTVRFTETAQIPTNIVMYDLSGKMIHRQETNAAIETHIDVTKFAPGIYLLQSGSHRERVVVE